MNPKFSVIIPVYNAMNFVERGMNCLVNQSFKDLEIIAINDGSTDQSGDVLDRLALKDSRVKVIHKNNEGVGCARNDGIRCAKGDYIYFMDIDDVLDLNFFSDSSQLLSHYGHPDLLIFGFNVSDKGVLDTVQIADKFINCRNELSACYTSDILKVRYGSGFLWNKLFKRSIIEDNNIEFCAYKLMEDELFNIEYIKYVETVCLSNKPYYTYFLNNNGNSRSKYYSNILEILESVYSSFLQMKESIGITDCQFSAHLNNRTFIGIMNWCRLYAFNSDNMMNYDDKKQQLKSLKESRVWNLIYDYISCESISIEHRLYAHAIQTVSVFQLRVYVTLYSVIRSILNNIRHA